MNRRGRDGSVSNAVTVGRGLRVAFLGMPCPFSVPPLAALLDAGFDVRAVVLPQGDGEHAVLRLARQASIPVVDVGGRWRPDEVAAIVAHQPDILTVACFPWRLPRAVRDLAPLGALNVHPSLLPIGRGPEPVFWTLRRGERRTGATIHLMDDGLDTGPIVAQEGFDVPDGIRAPDLEQRLAELGARLLVEAIPALDAGTVASVPQDDALATDAPVPTEADYLVPMNLPARWAFNFVRGVAPLGGPLTLIVGATGERYPVVDALAYDAGGTLDRPMVADREMMLVRFRPGVVRVVVDNGMRNAGPRAG